MLRYLGPVSGRPNAAAGEGPVVPPTVRFTVRPQTVGRNHENDVVLENYNSIPLLISRTHAVLYREDEAEDAAARAAAAAEVCENPPTTTGMPPQETTLRSRFFVEDNGSMNGTYVNGEMVPRDVRIALRDRDVVTFGGPEEVMRNGRKVENPYRFYFDENDDETSPVPAMPAARPESLPDASGAGQGQAPPPPPPPPPRAADDGDCPPASSPEALVDPVARLALRRGASGAEAAVAEDDQQQEAAPPKKNKRGHDDGEGDDQREAPSPNMPPPPLPKRRKVVLKPIPGSEQYFKEMESEWQCPICQDWLVGAHALGCGHTFCGDCVGKWREKSDACPVCRCTLEAPPVPVRSIDAMIERMCVPHMQEKDREERNLRKEAIETKVKNRLERARRSQPQRGGVAMQLAQVLSGRDVVANLEELAASVGRAGGQHSRLQVQHARRRSMLARGGTTLVAVQGLAPQVQQPPGDETGAPSARPAGAARTATNAGAQLTLVPGAPEQLSESLLVASARVVAARAAVAAAAAAIENHTHTGIGAPAEAPAMAEMSGPAQPPQAGADVEHAS